MGLWCSPSGDKDTAAPFALNRKILSQNLGPRHHHVGSSQPVAWQVHWAVLSPSL